MQMLKYFLSFLLLFMAGLAYPQDGLQQFINHPALKHASVGVSVVELESGRSVVAHDADKSLTPASVLKLITTATALETFGESHRYKTEVALDADDPTRVLVLGSGDPTLGSEVFKDNPNAFFINGTETLKKNLPTSKEYSIYVVDNLFGYDGISPEWTWIDIGNYYAPGAYGISIWDNSYRLFFNTTDRNNCPIISRTEPEIKGLTFQNSLTLNTTGRDNGYIYGAPFSYKRELRGDIPGGRTEFSIKGDIPDPGLLLGETFANQLRQAGFRIAQVETAREEYLSRNRVDKQPEEPYRVSNVLFTQVSRPLKEIIREINVKSNNHYAEHLIRSIGRNTRYDIYSDALQAGTEQVADFWSQKGIPVTSLMMHDGCGLAPQNAVSARFLTDLLLYMHNQSDYAEPFIYSLPKAGQEGTVQGFLRNSRLSGKVLVKSGSIGGVQCYAGYFMEGNKRYAFAIMVNKFSGSRSQVRSAIEQFLLGM